MTPDKPTAAAAKQPAKPKPRAAAKNPAKKPARRAQDPAKKWASYLRRYRPGLVPYVLDGLTARYGEQQWERRLDPVSELILTILTQNTADINAEKAFEALRAKYPSDRAAEEHRPGIGWGGDGLSTAPPPDWTLVEHAPLPIQMEHALHAGGLPRHHADPFDRLIVAQGQLEDLPIVTIDPLIGLYDVETIW